MAIEKRGGSYRVLFPHPATGWSPPAQLPFADEQKAKTFDQLWKLRRTQGRLGALYSEVFPDAEREQALSATLGDFITDEFWPHWKATPGRGRSDPKAEKTWRQAKRNLDLHVYEAVFERDERGRLVRNAEGEPVVLDWGAEALAWEPVAELDAATTLDYARRLKARGLGGETQRKLLTFLGAAYDHAVVVYPQLWGKPNPFKQVPKPSQVGRRRVEPMWPETIERLRANFAIIAELARARHDGRLSRAHAKKLRTLGWPVPEEPYLADFSVAACSALAYSSVRPQELLALPVTCIDGKRLRVARHNEDGHIKPGTKSTRYPTKRPLLIGPGAADLHAWRTRLNAYMTERGPKPLLLFPRADGQPFHEDDYRNWRSRYFKPVALRLHFDEDAPEGPRPYQCRHLYGTLRVAAGHDIVAIQASMGTSLVADVYASVREEYEDKGQIDIDAEIATARAAAPALAAADFCQVAAEAELPEQLVVELLAAAAVAA